MAAKKEVLAPDAYMNFKRIDGVTGANASTLVEAHISTGLSIRGSLLWLIHQIEYYLDMATLYSNAALNEVEGWLSLSTRAGLASMPQMADDGVVDQKIIQMCYMGANVLGDMIAHQHVQPLKSNFLPPVPLAASGLSLYWAADTNNANLQSKPFACRVGFTTSKLDAAAYTEVAETWGW